VIRHCVVLRFRDDAPDGAVDRVVDALRTLPAQIPQIRSYEVGADLGWREGNAELGIVATFDDRDGWRTYVEHPAHVAVIEQHIAPYVRDRTSVQFET
jgi:hypothetical protein